MGDSTGHGGEGLRTAEGPYEEEGRRGGGEREEKEGGGEEDALVGLALQGGWPRRVTGRSKGERIKNKEMVVLEVRKWPGDTCSDVHGSQDKKKCRKGREGKLEENNNSS